MGKRLENWLSKASRPRTRELWSIRWKKFANWVVSDNNPLTDAPYMSCDVYEVDDAIRRDFETMPSHIFQDKYRDILTKYVASFGDTPSNTVGSYIASVRSFFSNEATSIRLQKGKIPAREMAMNEHRFTLEELHRMWLVADTEGKARLSVAVSLGWSVGDFVELEKDFIENILNNVDADGYAVFDYRRRKPRARVRGILNTCAVHDIKNYLPHIAKEQRSLWSAGTEEGLNKWLKSLVNEAGIKENGTVRFHIIRKYVFDVVSSQCGVYEAKLLTGKTIALEDATYLHGLEDRLLERYKKFAYPFLNLNGQRREQANKMEELETKLEKMEKKQRLEREALLSRLGELEAEVKARREVDETLNALFKDEKFLVALRERLNEIKT